MKEHSLTATKTDVRHMLQVPQGNTKVAISCYFNSKPAFLAVKSVSLHRMQQFSILNLIFKSTLQLLQR